MAEDTSSFPEFEIERKSRQQGDNYRLSICYNHIARTGKA